MIRRCGVISYVVCGREALQFGAADEADHRSKIGVPRTIRRQHIRGPIAGRRRRHEPFGPRGKSLPSRGLLRGRETKVAVLYAPRGFPTADDKA